MQLRARPFGRCPGSLVVCSLVQLRVAASLTDLRSKNLVLNSSNAITTYARRRFRYILLYMPVFTNLDLEDDLGFYKCHPSTIEPILREGT